MASKQLSLKLLIDNQTNLVIYAESGKDFVDILLSFLTMPISSIIRLTTRHSRIGSLNSLYESVKDLDMDYLQTKACKNMLLHPRSSAEEQFKNLVLDIDEDTDPSEYYICPDWDCASNNHRLVSTVEKARCSCGQVMSRRVHKKKQNDEVDGRDGVFVKRGTEFMISDDLHVFPVSSTKSLELIKKLGINQATRLEQRNVNVGRREVLHLLNRLLLSKTPLTDVFVEEKDTIGINLTSLNPTKEDVMETDSNKITLKLFMIKSSNRILYAEGREEFPNLLFSFLTFPLGSIVRSLKPDTSMECLDNLYTSIVELSINHCIRSQECTEMLLGPKLAPHFGCQNQLLEVDEQFPDQRILLLCERCDRFGPCIEEYDNRTCSYGAIQLRTLNPKYPTVVTECGGAFMAGPALFMVTDDLIVKPLSPISGISLLNGLNATINDLEERFVTVRKEEVLSMLKASLISKTVLNDVFPSKKTPSTNTPIMENPELW